MLLYELKKKLLKRTLELFSYNRFFNLDLNIKFVKRTRNDLKRKCVTFLTEKTLDKP